MWTSLCWGINLCVLGVPLVQVHWDLRDQYLDWADNWFPATDVWDPPQALRQLLSKETWATKKAAEYVWEMLLQNFKLASCTIYPMIRYKSYKKNPRPSIHPYDFSRNARPSGISFMKWSNLHHRLQPQVPVAAHCQGRPEWTSFCWETIIHLFVRKSLMNMRWWYNAMIWYGAVIFAITFFEGASTRYILFLKCHVHSSEVKSAFRQMERPPPAPAPPKGLSWDQKRLCDLAQRNSGTRLDKLVSWNCSLNTEQV